MAKGANAFTQTFLAQQQLKLTNKNFLCFIKAFENLLLFCKLERALKIHHTLPPKWLWHRIGTIVGLIFTLEHITLFIGLAKLFYLCRCPSLLCFSLVLFLLFLGVGFRLSLASSWGCLSLVLHVFICFIRSLEMSRTKLGRFFTYPLT